MFVFCARYKILFPLLNSCRCFPLCSLSARAFHMEDIQKGFRRRRNILRDQVRFD